MGIGGGRQVIFGKMVVIKNSFLFPPLLYTTISPYLGQECNRRRKKGIYFYFPIREFRVWALLPGHKISLKEKGRLG